MCNVLYITDFTTLFTKITAAENEATLTYHKVRGLYFLAVIFAATIMHLMNYPLHIVLAVVCTRLILTSTEFSVSRGFIEEGGKAALTVTISGIDKAVASVSWYILSSEANNLYPFTIWLSGNQSCIHLLSGYLETKAVSIYYLVIWKPKLYPFTIWLF